MLACLSSGLSTLQSLIKLYNVAAVVLAISPERALCLKPREQVMSRLLLTHAYALTART